MKNAEVLLVLVHERASIVDMAAESIRARRTRYDAAGEDEVRQRLDALYEQLLHAITMSDLNGAVEYAEAVADERYTSGYDLFDVQAAINALEEASWARLCDRLPPEELAVPLGVVSTVLGATKDALAREYVTLASQAHVTSLDMRALFAGDAAV
jgi:hypothetical protein